MKHTMALIGMGVATILLSSAAFAQKTPESKETKKTRHIKMTKIENGKKMELDTVLAGTDVFIWNGDTLNSDKKFRKFSPSEFDKMHRFEVEVEEGDSVQKRIIIHKRMKDGDEDDRFVFLNGQNMKHFPPRPPMPPMPPHAKMMKVKHSGRIIDLNDPNIISYKKKNLSGEREKIEIIRKKSEAHEEMNFNFEMEDAMLIPEPPEPPAFMDELNIEESEPKKVEKEIEVKVETKENK